MGGLFVHLLGGSTVSETGIEGSLSAFPGVQGFWDAVQNCSRFTLCCASYFCRYMHHKPFCLLFTAEKERHGWKEIVIVMICTFLGGAISVSFALPPGEIMPSPWSMMPSAENWQISAATSASTRLSGFVLTFAASRSC